MRLLAGTQRLAIGIDELDGDEVVASEPVLAREKADATAEGQPGDADRRAAPGGQRVGVLVEAPIHVGEPRTCADMCVPVLQGNPGEFTEIDEQSGGCGPPGEIVSAAAHRHGQAVVLRETKCGCDIGGGSACHHRLRTNLTKALPGRSAGRIVAGGIAGQYDASDPLCQSPPRPGRQRIDDATAGLLSVPDHGIHTRRAITRLDMAIEAHLGT